MEKRYDLRSHNMKKRHAFSLQQSFVRVMVLGVFSMLVGATPLQGAETSPGASAGYALTKGTNEFGLWAGGSPESTGNIEDRQLFLFALRYGRVLAAWESVAFLGMEWTPRRLTLTSHFRGSIQNSLNRSQSISPPSTDTSSVETNPP